MIDERLKVVNHVVCLLSEAFEVMEQIRNAPESPVTSYLPAAVRRAFRRNAKRLRRRSIQPQYGNLYTPEDLAIILELAAERDETIEHGFEKLTRIVAEIKRVREYRREDLEEGTRIVYEFAWQRAQEDGPGSKAAEFFELFQEMIVKGHELRTVQRRRKDVDLGQPFHLPGADPARAERERIIAAEILAEAPDSGVLLFSSDTIVSEEPPVILRIGIGDRSWVGSFARGTTDCTRVQLMPDGAHILVVACGAGYVVEAVTRSLAREAGTDIMEVLLDEDAGHLILDRADAYFEAFGPNGPLWKTGRIGAGAFRNLEISDRTISGETRQGSSPDWIEFSVDRGTGEIAWKIPATNDVHEDVQHEHS